MEPSIFKALMEMIEHHSSPLSTLELKRYNDKVQELFGDDAHIRVREEDGLPVYKIYGSYYPTGGVWELGSDSNISKAISKAERKLENYRTGSHDDKKPESQYNWWTV